MGTQGESQCFGCGVVGEGEEVLVWDSPRREGVLPAGDTGGTGT
jgi:hypothetical protein